VVEKRISLTSSLRFRRSTSEWSRRICIAAILKPFVQQLSEAQAFIEEGGLDHRFKSMFGQSSASAEDIETLLKFLKQQQK